MRKRIREANAMDCREASVLMLDTHKSPQFQDLPRKAKFLDGIRMVSEAEPISCLRKDRDAFLCGKQGFTLIEITVAVVILGIFTAIALPTYYNYIQQAASQNAQYNLKVIYNSQKNYYLNYGGYCVDNCDNLADINTRLSLNLTDSYYVYTCACRFSSSCGTLAVAYCYAQLSNYPQTFLYETAHTLIYGTNTLSPNSGTLSCGSLAASVGLHGAACESSSNSCPYGTTYEGATFDCVSCCAD